LPGVSPEETEMKRSANSAFTLIEVVVSGVIIVLAVAMLVTSLQYCSRASQTAREKTMALNGARSMLETLRSMSVKHIFLTYGPGGAVGPDFDVEGLRAADGDGDGHCGLVTVYTDESENVPRVGLPRDLNGDGDADDSGADVTDNYWLVPVRVDVGWQGVSGSSSVTLYAIIGQRRDV